MGDISGASSSQPEQVSHDYRQGVKPNDNRYDETGLMTSRMEVNETSLCRKVMYVAIGFLVMAAMATGFVCGTGQCVPSSNSGSPEGDEPPAVSPPSPSPPKISLLAEIKNRGLIRCGVMDLPYQATLDQGEMEGFTADMCRAVAAAMFGTAVNTLEFEVVTAENAFQWLADGKVDLLVSGATFTMERDLLEPSTGQGFSFSTPYFYDGMFYGGDPQYVECAEALSLNQSINGLSCGDLSLCVVEGTTHENILSQIFPDEIKVIAIDQQDSYQRFSNNDCNVMAAESLMLAEPIVADYGYSGNYAIGTIPFSKEPLCIVTTEEDPVWSDFVNWVLEALLLAEEQNISQINATLIQDTPYFGQEYQKMFVDAIAAVGSYKEIYDRHLTPVIARSGANRINRGTSGLIYSMPFGNLSPNNRGTARGVLEEIRSYGELRCGIARRALFADIDSNGQYTGHDVDFCKAIAAAIFNGQAGKVNYITLHNAEERFLALQNNQVDVLSRITTVNMERDVKEHTTGVGYSFSQPNFYDGLTFGGIPPFGDCADRISWSGECAGLKICVTIGTTYEQKVTDLFPSYVKETVTSGSLLAEQLGDRCNAIGGGVGDVSLRNVRDKGYDGDYEIGKNRLTKDPLALATRQDDPQWSSFCYWIVSLLFYAEEHGITAATAESQLPIVELFGSPYLYMFRDAVSAVGSFGEIYERNMEADVPRGSLNDLNQHPYGPQHYPLPGIQYNAN